MRAVRYRLSVISLISVFLVMLAGSLVRMTGSGMGCPDWPKCFGYLIPPTDIEKLTFQSGRTFEKGNIIIYEEGLLVAKHHFEASQEINLENWEPYMKHDYALFNPTHTWIEFLNRLVGVFAGLPILALFVVSLFRFRKDPFTLLLSALGLFLLGFEAWLGKLVVDGNLIPHSISYHLFGALGLVAIYTLLVARLRFGRAFGATLSYLPNRGAGKRCWWLGFVVLLMLLVQIWMGTGLREEIDHLNEAGLPRPMWVQALTELFEVHRSFSILILGAAGLFAWAFWRLPVRQTGSNLWPKALLGLVVSEIFAGIILAYAGVPQIVQPVHLMLAVFIFAVLFYGLIDLRLVLPNLVETHRHST